tara:strand:+ start:77806 stop:78099 length:294 start_codon:yes stop_codon:yes gene_type:complete
MQSVETREARYTSEDEVDLLEFCHLIRDSKWLVIVITTVFAVGSGLYALCLPDTYGTEVLLAPANYENGGGALGRQLGQFGGLTSLSGINLDTAGEN